MTFLEVVNRIFRSNGLIKGDDDAITSFSDTAHNAAIQLALIAVQDELNDLISDNIIPYEVTSGEITTSASTRTYALAADFVRFYGKAMLYQASANRPLFEYPGGREALAVTFWDYQTSPGDPTHWYMEPTTSKKIGFWQVPDGVRTYRYEYERSVSVSDEADTMPFHSDAEGQAFSMAAGRRFKALNEDRADLVNYIRNDPTYTSARSTLMGLMKGKNSARRYGTLYR
jgi:hypothetical protein